MNVAHGNVPITSDTSANSGATLYRRRHLRRRNWWTLSTEETSLNELTYLFSSLGPSIHDCAKSNHAHPHRTPGLSHASFYLRTCSYSCCLRLLIHSGLQRTRGTVVPQSRLSRGLDNRTSWAGTSFLNNGLPFLLFRRLTVLRFSIAVTISSRMGHSSMKLVLIHGCSLIIYTIKWISQCRCLREIYRAYFVRNDSQSRRADTVVSDFTIGESLPEVRTERWTDWFLLSLSVGCTCGVGKKASQTWMRFMSPFETRAPGGSDQIGCRLKSADW